MSFISGPVPPYNNPPITPQYYQPRRYVISNITFGQTTLITTFLDHDYVIGQKIRLLIPAQYGATQLNNVDAYVLSIPSANEVEINIVSEGDTPFNPDPYTATITGATQSDPCVLTANNSFSNGQYIFISGVQGMTPLNNRKFLIIGGTTTTITIYLDSTSFPAYAGGGTAALTGITVQEPQIIAIGDVNSGQINSSGRAQTGTFIPGSFINISPQ